MFNINIGLIALSRGLESASRRPPVVPTKLGSSKLFKNNLVIHFYFLVPLFYFQDIQHQICYDIFFIQSESKVLYF